MKPQYRVLLVAAAIFGVGIFYMAATNGDVGTVRRTDTGITHVYSKAEGDSSFSMPVTLQEGSDVEHESSHVFDALNGLIGVESATLRLDGASIEVAYSSKEIAQEDIRKVFAASGYTPEQ